MTEKTMALPWTEEDTSLKIWHRELNQAALKSLAAMIPLVHEERPDSWSVLGTRVGTVALTVWGYSVISVARTRCHLILPGSPDEARYEGLPGVPAKETIAERGSVFRLERLELDEYLSVYARFQREIQDALTWLCGQQGKGTFSRNQEHRPDLVDALASLIDAKLPQPSFFNPEPVTRDQLESRSWLIRQASHPVIDSKNQHRDGFVRFAWPNPRIDLGALPPDLEQFSSELLQAGLSNAEARRLFAFVHGIEVGDRIAVADGPYEFTFSAGEVTGPYVFADDDPVYPHRRPITALVGFQPMWLGHQNDDLSQLRYGWGPIALTEDEYGAMLIPAAQNESKGTETPSATQRNTHALKKAPIEGLLHHFGASGYVYTPNQLATFYTALQTKGFVVLSGISGTGKSKIAQGFVDLLPHPTSSTQPPSIDRESVIQLSVKPYTRKYRRVVIPVTQLGPLPPMNPGDQLVVPLRLGTTTGTGRLSAQLHPGGNTVTYLYFRGQIADQIRDLELGTPLYLIPESRSHDEGLDSISLFTNDADLPEDVSSPATNEPRNSLFLSVRPDWRDSTSLLGYYNPLTQTYEWTEFLHFLLKAAKSFENGDNLAWFVILDEMNLAHVEYYFADLLSIIESGRDDDGWSREPVRLTYPDTLTDNAPPREIKLPPNLYIIGTVNMDETTHAFSPKVLDRAFTIELTDVDFSNYPPVPTNVNYEITDDERQALLKAFTRDGRFAQVSKADVHAAVQAHPEMRRWLHNLNTRLAKHQFHFGYRVFDEIAQFIHNADDNGMFVRDGIDPDVAWQEAFDHAVYMKVLPKFNGSHARLSGPLNTLLDWARNPDAPMDGQSAAERGSIEDAGEDPTPAGPAPRLNRVASRAQSMIDTLEANGFVSFG